MRTSWSFIHTYYYLHDSSWTVFQSHLTSSVQTDSPDLLCTWAPSACLTGSRRRAHISFLLMPEPTYNTVSKSQQRSETYAACVECEHCALLSHLTCLCFSEWAFRGVTVDSHISPCCLLLFWYCGEERVMLEKRRTKTCWWMWLNSAHWLTWSLYVDRSYWGSVWAALPWWALCWSCVLYSFYNTCTYWTCCLIALWEEKTTLLSY